MAEKHSYVNLGDSNFDQLFPDDISQKSLLNKNFIRFYNITLNIIYYKLICLKKKWGYSSIGRALPLQGRGQRFETAYLQ